MSITHRISIGIASASDGTPSGSSSGSTLEAGSTETSSDVVISSDTYDYDLTVSFTTSNLQSLVFKSDKNCTLKFGGTNEVQRLTITGTPTGGTFTMSFNGQTTAAIAYNATAAAVQSALEALSNIAAGEVACTGGPLPGSVVDIEFRNGLGKQNVSAMTTTDSLTGGTTPATAITTPTPGVAPDKTITLKAGDPFVWTRSNGYYACPFSTSCSHIYVTTTDATRVQGFILVS